MRTLKKLAAVCLILIAGVLLSASGWKTDAETLRMRNAKTVDHWFRDIILLEDGTVLDDMRVLFDGVTDIVSVSAAETYSAALRSDGTVVVTVGDEPDRVEAAWEGMELVDLSVNFMLSPVGLKPDGTLVFTTDSSDNPVFQTVLGWKDVVSVESCFFFIAVLHSDGTVEAANCGNGIIYDLSDWSDIVQIAVSEANVYGLRSDGRVLVGGMDMDYSGLEEWTDVVGIFPAYLSPIGLRADGTLLALDNYRNMDYLRAWDNMAAVAPYGSLGVQTDGTLVFENEYSWFQSKDVKVRLPWLPLAEENS